VLTRILYVLIAAFVYFHVLTRYAPSDVTQGLWLYKPDVVIAIGSVVGLFLAIRLVKIAFFTNDKKIRRLLITVFFLPSYVFMALFIVIAANGLLDKQEDTRIWPTYLAYYKDMKLACVTAAYDDTMIEQGATEATVLFVPRDLCRNIDDAVNAKDKKSPYAITFSTGRLGIDYILDIQKDTSLHG
jgi:hypothetical protein